MIDESTSKAEIVEAIAHLLHLSDVPKMSTGSTEPRELFDWVNEGLGLGLDHSRLTKPEIAQGIVEASGLPWLPTYESRGGTVTREGLFAVFLAVKFFLDGESLNL